MGFHLRPHGGEAQQAAPSEARDLNGCAPSPVPIGHSRIACVERYRCSERRRLVAQALTGYPVRGDSDGFHLRPHGVKHRRTRGSAA